MPHPERIFHYTSIDTLALILKSKKIRFSRLDTVDDAKEAPTVQGISFNKYFFVSCWTTEITESIPQWHLYTDKMSGVRIELPSYPFINKPLIPESTWVDFQTTGTLVSPVSFQEMYGDTYMILPILLDRDHFAGPVEYIHNLEERYEAAVTITKTTDIHGSIAISSPWELVRLKTKHWGFQSEYRFALFVLPSLPLPPEGPGSPSFYNSAPAHMMRSIQTGHAPNVQSIDLDFRPDALDGLVITTGPHCSAGAKLSVDALVKQYAPNGRVQSSELEGWLRPR